MDDGWQPTEAEIPTIVEVHADAKALESAAANVNGHDRSPSEAEATDSQRTLFSWAEFMTEATAKRKGRSRNTQPSLSLFEWAVAGEQAQAPGDDKVAIPA